MEYQKVTNLLHTTSDSEPGLITKKWIEVYDQSGNAENRYKQSKQIRFKTTTLNQTYVITVMYILLLKKLTMLQIQKIMHIIRN